jgi:hypothetical protein
MIDAPGSQLTEASVRRPEFLLCGGGARKVAIEWLTVGTSEPLPVGGRGRPIGPRFGFFHPSTSAVTSFCEGRDHMCSGTGCRREK